MKKIVSVLALVGVLFGSSTALADSATTTILSVDTHATYVEIAFNSIVCGSLGSTWGKRLRVNHSDAPKADFVLRIAIAALLANRTVTVDATSNGAHCMIDALQM